MTRTLNFVLFAVMTGIGTFLGVWLLNNEINIAVTAWLSGLFGYVFALSDNPQTQEEIK